MQISRFFLLLLAIFSPATFSSPVKSRSCNTTTSRLLHQFPLGTWIENIAVRSNGQLLITLLNKPQLYLIDPFKTIDPVLIHTFPNALGLTGIAEVKPDSFVVTSLNFSLTTVEVAPGSAAAWKVDLNHADLSTSSNYTTLSRVPKISKIADLPSNDLPNGVCKLDGSEDKVLIAETHTGSIFRLDTQTGVSIPVLNNSMTKAVPQPILGIAGANGVHVRHNTVYYTNTGLEIFAKTPINPDGTPAGNSTIVSRALMGDSYDDFALRGEYAYLVTASGNSVVRMKLDGTSGQETVAGSLNSTVIAEPTAAMFGRTEWDRDILYVVTAGGLATGVVEDGEVIKVGAQVVAVDLRGSW